MKIFVKAKPRAKEEKIEKISENTYFIKVKEPPEKGRANKAIVRLLSEFLKIPQSNIKIISGETSKTKIVQIN